jgi:hypothetical protein
MTKGDLAKQLRLRGVQLHADINVRGEHFITVPKLKDMIIAFDNTHNIRP